MIFRRRWSIITLVVVSVVFIVVAAILFSTPLKPCDNGGQSLSVTESYTATPSVTEETDSAEETEDTVESTSPIEKPQTSGYKISYIDEEFDIHLIRVMRDFSINLDPSYVYAIIFCESTFRSTVKSPSGAIGYMQVLPSTRDYILPMIKRDFPQYSELPEDLVDPYINVVYGLYYLRHSAEMLGDNEVNEENINKVLTCYNRGIAGGEQYFKSTGHWNSEHAKKVMRIAQQIRTNGGM